MASFISQVDADTKSYIDSHIDKVRSSNATVTHTDCIDTNDILSKEKSFTKKTGKVRDLLICKDCVVMIATDRQSAFDRQLTAVPFKGQVLNLTSLWWFENTKHLVPNHVLASPHPNITIGKKCTVFPVEFVMRGYITGTTSTSMWTNYAKGVRNYCGHLLPDGLLKNQELDASKLTPTTKDDNHDELICAEEIVSSNRMTLEDWKICSKYAHDLFAYSQAKALEKGLILVDTKYEFGKDCDGNILLIDEVQTPDSSRYWIASSYESRMSAGEEPENIDKEFLRKWYAANCDPYNDKVLPEAPAELVNELSRRYIMIYEILTGIKFDFDSFASVSIEDCLVEYFKANLAAENSLVMSVVEEHFRTLDLMGQVRQLKAYTDPSDFLDFVKFAVSTSDCKSFDDVATFLTGRYKHWVSSGDFDNKRAMFEDAWLSLRPAKLPDAVSSSSSSRFPIAIDDDDDDDDDDESGDNHRNASPQLKKTKISNTGGSSCSSGTKAKAKSNSTSSSGTKKEVVADGPAITSTDDISAVSSNSIPIVIKPSSWEKNTVVCICNDSELSFEGDMGAVGRIISSKDSFSLDIKGRQYSASMSTGPTIMIINLAPPVAQQKSAQVTARVETLTNEHCNLQFVSDTIGNISGNIIGDMDGDEINDDDKGDNSNHIHKKKGSKKRKKSSNDDDDDDDSDDRSAYGDDDDDDDRDEVVKGKKGPKISTITNRSRVKDGKRGKKSKPKSKPKSKQQKK